MNPFFTTLAIWIYNEKVVVFANISNPYPCKSKITDLIRPVEEWVGIAFSARQNAENEHCETLKKLLHKLTFIIKNAYTRHQKWNSCITTQGILEYIEKEVVYADIFNPNTSKSKIIDLIRPVEEWSEIAFSAAQNAENEHCETVKKLLPKLNFRH